MPSEIDHIALANKSHLALMVLHEDATEHSEWVVSVGFYKALHVVSAIFENRSFPNHVKRNDYIKSVHPDIWKHYRPLYQASLVARYLFSHNGNSGYSNFSDYCEPDKVYSKFIVKRLKTVEDLCVSKLSSTAKDKFLRIKQ